MTTPEHRSIHYRKKALPRAWVRPVLRREQSRIFRRYVDRFPPVPDHSILDLGVDGSLERAEDYFFEHEYPFPEQIVAAGLEAPDRFRGCHPRVPYVQVERGQSLPFGERRFDIVFCSAVIEHVGDQAAQHAFLQEILRVGRCVFVTTPNRWYPVELHTMTPLLHWLPPAIHRPLYRRLGLEFFSREENLNLLDIRALRALVEDVPGVRIDRHWFLGLPSNLILTVAR